MAQRLNIAEGIRVADAATGDYLYEALFGDADSGERGFVTVEKALEAKEFKSPVCPICKKTLSQKEPMLHAKGQKYQALYECAEHGEMMLVGGIKRNINETFRLRVILMRADEERLSRYREKLANEREFRRSHRRSRRGGKREGSKTTSPSA